jgi:hydroxyacylglutathione hydrolase
MNTFFNRCRLQIGGLAYVLPAETLDLLRRGAILVDLREELETEIKAFGIEKIIYMPYSSFDKTWQALPENRPLIFADSVGLHSKEAMVFLRSKGYENIAGLAGGFADWMKDGYPVKAGKYTPLNGPCPCMIVPKEKKSKS